MIKGVHTMFYSSDAVGLRNFFRDKLNLKATDVGDGWLIFDLPKQTSVAILQMKYTAHLPVHMTSLFIVMT
jgi:hypothetical protein